MASEQPAAAPPPFKKSAFWSYPAAAFLSVLVTVFVFRTWERDLAVPLGFEGDGIPHAFWFKAVIEEGWYLQVPRQGAPGTMDFYDFPQVEGLHFLLAKALSWFVSDPMTVLNLFYLATYPLTALAAMYAFRQFGAGTTTALVGSLLYTFQPYHLQRGVGHLFLACYYTLPLTLVVLLRIYQDRIRFRNAATDGAEEEGGRTSPLAAAVICLLQSSASVYYAFFSCFLLLTAGAASAAQRKMLRPLVAAALLVGVVVGGVLANLAPSVAYGFAHGKNREACRRPASDAEVFGLKLTQVLLPVANHQAPPLARLREKYETRAPLSNENMTASIGFYGSLGFLCLVGSLFVDRWKEGDVLRGLSLLNLAAVLLGSIGGFGALFNYLVTPQIRCYNRISIFIALFSLLAGALLLERLAAWMRTSGRPAWQFQTLMAATLAIGLWDQIPASAAPSGREAEARWRRDAAYFARLESALPAGTMVYQLPYMVFPGSLPIHQLTDYQHARPYFHTRSLRFSYGCMRGRPLDAEMRVLADKPIEEQLPKVAAMGFRAVYVDRRGFADRGAAIEGALAKELGSTPIADAGGDVAVFDMQEYAARLESGRSSDARPAPADAAPPLEARAVGGPRW